MHQRSFSSFAAAAGLALSVLACENDVVRVDDNDTAVGPYFREDDAGIELVGSDAASDAGQTVQVPCSEDAECDDGDSCTGSEACVAGFCRAGEHPTCFDGDPCTTDACIQATGTCSFTTVRDGLPCDDGNLCDGQTCSNGTCVAGPAPVCAADANRCTSHSCDPASGACVMLVLADGASCSDGDACNGAETCSNGTCQAAAALGCNDHNPCTSDACDAAVGCVNLGLVDGTACPDGDLCNGSEVCQAGICQTGSAPSCDDFNPCTTDSCVSASGACVFSALANGTACPDGNLCDGQTCNSGVCSAGSPVVCAVDNDNNACTFNACQPATGTCVQSSFVDGTPCADANLCNGQESCVSGRCIAPAGPLVCGDDNPCTSSVCSATTGCVTLNVPDGTSCADADPCNGIEQCSAGFCTAGAPVTCTNLQTCSPSTGTCVL